MDSFQSEAVLTVKRSDYPTMEKSVNSKTSIGSGLIR